MRSKLVTQIQTEQIVPLRISIGFEGRVSVAKATVKSRVLELPDEAGTKLSCDLVVHRSVNNCGLLAYGEACSGSVCCGWSCILSDATRAPLRVSLVVPDTLPPRFPMRLGGGWSSSGLDARVPGWWE